MKTMTIFHLSLLAWVFAAAKSTTGSYDELQLVFQWPISYSNTGLNQCIDPIPLQFTVHGLWPSRNSQSVNRNYLAKTRTAHRISEEDLREFMIEHWPNLNSRTPIDFLWRHEYQKHGRRFFNPEDYFQAACIIATDIGDVLQMRLRKGRTLTRGQFYNVNEFNPVTIAGEILIPRLRCNYASDSAYPQLQEIVFCADRNYILKNCTYDFGFCRQDRYGNVLIGPSFKLP